MGAKFIFALGKYIAKFFILSSGILIVFCNSANAVLINFDDLDPNSYSSDGAPTYLTNEYEAQGLLLVGAAYLVEWSEWNLPVSLPNYVAGPGFGLEFVGELPTFVSFYLGSSVGTAVFIDVQGPYYSKHITSSGEIHGMTDNHGTPYIPNQVFSFAARTGISSISFSGQGDAYIDDLTYTYAPHASVPEPETIVLFSIGLLGILTRRFKLIKN